MAGSREGLLWQGKPDLRSVLTLVMKYAGPLFLLSLGRFGFIATLVLLAAIIHITILFIQLKMTRYRVSSERIEITSGLLNHTTETYEAHQVTDVTIRSPFPLSFLGVSHIDVGVADMRAYNDRANGLVPVRIVGVPTAHAEGIRDSLRETGRQEAARLDLVRFR